MTSQAKISHKSASRKVDKHGIYSYMPYIIYLNTKNKKPTITNTVSNFWHFLGVFILSGGLPLLLSKETEPFFCYIKSFFFTFNHLSEVKNGDFRFMEPLLQTNKKS
jgi:hypothetical protein